eukprot:223599-Pleurochrysis_carterae.AAC.1
MAVKLDQALAVAVKHREDAKVIERNGEEALDELWTKAEKFRTELTAAKEHSRCLEAELGEAEQAVTAGSPPKTHSPNSYAALCNAGRRTARHRAVHFVQEFISSQSWLVEDLATAFSCAGILDQLWESWEIWVLRTEWVRELFRGLSTEHWGIKLG